MTRASVLALLAGFLAAAALVEIVALAGERSRRRAGRAGPTRAWVRWLGRLGLRARLPVRPAADLGARVAAAGLPSSVGVGEVMAVKVGAALTAGLFGLPLALSAPGRLGPVVALAAPAAGFLVPDAWLRRRARDRARAVAEELPEVLDLLRVVVGAGMASARALGEVGRRRGGVLAAELHRVAIRLELGSGRAEAYASLRERCPGPAVAALVGALQRAERHGVSLAPVLAALAAEARAQRTRRLADRAATAAPKIQLVIALALVPAVLFLVAAGLVSALD